MVVVALRFLVPTREVAGFLVEAELRVKQVGSVGVIDQVLEVVAVRILARTGVLRQAGLDKVVDDVLVHAAVEGDVRAAADGAVDIGLLGRASVARIDHDPLRAPVVRTMKVERGSGMALAAVRPAMQDVVGICHVGPMAGHGATTERRRQAHNGGAVAHAGLVVDGHHAQGAHHLQDEVLLLGILLATAKAGNGRRVVYGKPVLVGFNERLVAGVLHLAGNLLDSLLPGDVLPILSARSANHRACDAVGILDNLACFGVYHVAQLEHGCALRA